jgi:aspartyl-tRNA synthetase
LGIDPELPVVVLRIPQVGELSRKERDENRPLFDSTKGAKLLDDLKRLEKTFPDAVGALREQAGASMDDLLVLIAGDAIAPVKGSNTKSPGRLSEREIGVLSSAGNLRVELARKYADRHRAFAETDRVVAEAAAGMRQTLEGGSSGIVLVAGAPAFQPIWVTDFPMFEHDAETGRWLPSHHPFTAPHEADMERLTTDPASVRARYYDLAMNGLELGSGSIRIHRKDVQAKIFAALGMEEAEAKDRFGFFLEALEYGTPPHGGIALGLDRIVMILAGASSLREVIAFPKTAKAIDLMVDAPTPVSDLQLRDLHIRTHLKS